MAVKQIIPRPNFSKLIIPFFVLVLVAVFGCVAMQDVVTPAYIDMFNDKPRRVNGGRVTKIDYNGIATIKCFCGSTDSMNIHWLKEA